MKPLTLAVVVAHDWQSQDWASGWHYEIHSNRLDCDICACNLEQKFMKIEGVMNYKVDLDGIFDY